MTSLVGNGTITYNGWTFAGPRVRTTVEVVPQYDEANRTVVSVLHTLNVTAYVTDDANGTGGTGGTAKTNMAAIENALTKNGGQLTVTGLGYGDITVNTGGSDRDIRYGPRTRLLRFRPVAAIGCFEVTWVCESELAVCDASSGSFSMAGEIGVFREFNYGITYSINRSGYTRRTITGHLAIVLNRTQAGATTIPMHADSFRERVNPLIPPGFRREHQDWRLSPDKSRLDFTITDIELEQDNAYPDGIIQASLTHRAKWSRSGANQAVHTIGGTVEVAKPIPVSVGFEKFLLIIRDRIVHAKNSVEGVFIDHFDVAEHIFERRFDFSVQYRVLSGTGIALQNILTDGAVFFSLPSTNWAAWGNSLADTAWHRRGHSRLTHQVSSDRIIDPCNQAGNVTLADAGVITNQYGGSQSITNDCPPREKSYITWNSWVRVRTGSELMEHKPMSANASGGTEAYTLSDGTVIAATPDVTTAAVVQEIGDNTVIIELHGHGVRAGYPVEIPKVVSAWNQFNVRLSHLDSDIDNHPVGDYAGCAVYSSRWTIRYLAGFANPADIPVAMDNLHGIVITTPDDPTGKKFSPKDYSSM